MFVALNKAKEYLSIQMDPSMKENGKEDTGVGRAGTRTQTVTGMKELGKIM